MYNTLCNNNLLWNFKLTENKFQIGWIDWTENCDQIYNYFAARNIQINSTTYRNSPETSFRVIINQNELSNFTLWYGKRHMQLESKLSYQ